MFTEENSVQVFAQVTGSPGKGDSANLAKPVANIAVSLNVVQGTGRQDHG